MKACILRASAPIATNPLDYSAVPDPQPGPGEVLLRVRVCGVCRADLHVIEGELPPRKLPVIPGHQIVGVVEKLGEGATRFRLGSRVGILWLHSTDQTCEYCRTGKENLCDNPTFTGYSVDGGYAEYALAPEKFAYPIPDSFEDAQAAPLLCAGIISFPAAFGDSKGRAACVLRLRGRGAPRDSSSTLLGSRSVCMYARRKAPTARAATRRGLGRRGDR